MLFDVPHPGDVRVNAVDRYADQLHAQRIELRPAPRELYELRRTHRREVRGMGEEEHPLALRCEVAQPDLAVRALRGKVRSRLTQAGQPGSLGRLCKCAHGQSTVR